MWCRRFFKNIFGHLVILLCVFGVKCVPGVTLPLVKSGQLAGEGLSMVWCMLPYVLNDQIHIMSVIEGIQ